MSWPTLNDLIGRTISAVWLDAARETLCFDCLNTESVLWTVTADCCSSTWIEAIDDPLALIGTVRAVETLDLADREIREDDYGDYIQFYGIKVTTEMGRAVIEFRNKSNGYYGGGMEVGGDRFEKTTATLLASTELARERVPAPSADRLRRRRINLDS